MEHGGRHSNQRTNNVLISDKLPESYRVSDIPRQNCFNCMYSRNSYCKKWKETIHDEYLCMSWVGNKQTNIVKRGKR